MENRRTLLKILFLFILALPLSSHAASPKTEEGLYQINYDGIVRNDLIVQVSDTVVFIPLTQLLDLLGIYYDFDYPNKEIRGFFVNRDSLYAINFEENSFHFKSKDGLLNPAWYLVSQFDYYLNAKQINEIFPFKLKVHRNELDIRIESVDPLPVKIEYNRKKRYSFLENSKEGLYLPLVYDRNRSILKPGLLDYSMGLSHSDINRQYDFTSMLGLELLGGDLQVQSAGIYSKEIGLRTYKPNYRWRYFLSDNPFFTQIAFGNLSSQNLRSLLLTNYNHYGFQISNELTVSPTFFSDFLIEDQTEPGWQVELYRNGVLVDQQVADPLGLYKFSIPMNYGSSNIELRYYGLRGEYDYKREIINFPFDILKPGEIKYTLNYGTVTNDTTRVGHGRISCGIMDWMSLHLEGKKNEGSKDYTFGGALSLRILNNLTSNIYYYPGKLIRSVTNLWSLSFGSYSIQYSQFNGLSEYNLFGRKYEATFNAGVPTLLKLPINLNIYAYRSDIRDYIENYIIANSNLFINHFMFNIRYRADYRELKENNFKLFSHFINSDIFYSFSKSLFNLELLRGGRIGFSSSYSFNQNSFTSLGVNYEQKIADKYFLRFRTNWDNSIGGFSINAAFVMNYDFIKSESNVKLFPGNELFLSERLTGTLGLDYENFEFIASGSSSQATVGSGAAIIRLFADKNYNGIWDNNEELVPDVKIEVQNASVNRRRSDFSSTIYNISSYARYNVIIDKESIGNPLLVPKYTAFSFIADPNVYKAINIPCYPSGIIEGNVLRMVDNKKAPQKGVKIHVLARDSSFDQTLPVFSDGSFYYMGAPPGEYTAWVDSLQLEILKCDSRPPRLEFTVKKTTDGDYVGGLNFELIPRGGVLAAKPDKNENKPQKPIDDQSTRVQDESKAPSDESSGGPLIIKGFEELALNQKKIFSFDRMGTTNLTREMKSYLDIAATYMKQDTLAEISISGYADSTGNIMKVQDLSNKRAEIAAHYITKRGISDSRIFAKGLGAEYPLYIGPDKLQSAKNRRIEILLVKGSSVLAARSDSLRGKIIAAKQDTSGRISKADTTTPPKSEIPDMNLPKVKDLDIALQNFRPSEQAVFTYDKSTATVPTKAMREYLELAALYMQTHPECEISIVGHSDNFGSLEETQAVSERRAQGAARYLTDRGINKDRLLVRGEGSRAPAASNMTPEGRQKNRRVEIRILE